MILNRCCKISYRGFFLALVLVLFSSCQSAQFFLADLFSGDSSGTGTSTNQGKSSNSQGGTAITVRPLPVPQSYDQAYSYRTDVADKALVSFIKGRDVESLRKTNPNGWLHKVVEKINQLATNDFEKAKLAHDVVAVLVSYDAASFWSGALPPQDFVSVIKSGRAVCEGYAVTYKKICDTLSLSCKIVHGYARGVGTNLTNESNVKVANHAWNMVQIDGNWYLVDCTWDAGHMEGKVAKQNYNTDWLFLRPEHFIYSHLPTQSREQLLTPALSSQEFMDLPDLRPKFFQATSSVKPLPSKITTVGKDFTMEFTETRGFRLDFTVKNVSSGGSANNAFSVKRSSNGEAQLTFKLPSTGLYVVDIFYYEGNSRRGISCGQFLVQSQ